MGEQPLPMPGNEVVGHEVIKDLAERMELGRRRYGTYLQTFNCRSSLQDLYEELVDATMYVKQKIMEENEMAGTTSSLFVQMFNHTATVVHEIAEGKGWWDEPRNDGEIIALMHSELSEALEAMRHGNPPSDHIPDFSGVEEELADLIIRIMDMAPARGWRIAEALVAKVEFNRGRPHKHGGKSF